VGSYVDIVAPGDRIVAAAPGGGHLAFEGTSLAVPFVAATAALIRARYPSLGQADVVHRLLATADPAPGSRPSMEYGYGVLNPTRALTEVLVPRILGAASPAPLLGGSAEAGAAPTPAISTTLLAASVLVTAAMVILATAAALPLGRRRRWRPGVVADLPTLLGAPPPPSEPSAPAVPRQRRGHAPTPTAREPDRRGSPISR
jgi:membrane-anchored mycosin MYCP